MKKTLFFMLCGIVSAAEALTEFSADVTYFDNHNTPLFTGRLFVGNDAVREERSSSDEKEVRITDLFRGVTYVLNPQAEEYHQEEALPVPRNPARFCAEMMLLDCGLKSREEIGGRGTERWEAELGFGELSLGVIAWYDQNIQYPVRIELKDGASQQLSNIQIIRPSSALFSIPFNYRRVEQVDMVQSVGFPEWP